VPVAVSVHDTNPAELYASIRRADYVICVSEAVRRLVLGRFRHPERVVLLPNRIDRSVMRVLEGESFADLDAEHPWRRRLLCVGRLSPQKNQDTVIRALARLPEEYGCLFVGRNDPASLLELARQLGVAHRCRFMPSVRNDQLARYYNWSDCMVTPSRWEGFGLVFIEALACGAAVVTSNIAPMNEYIRHEENGLLVDEYEDAETVAAAIRRACEDKGLRARLRRTGTESVARFSREVVDRMEVDIYRRVLEEGPLRRGPAAGLGWLGALWGGRRK